MSWTNETFLKMMQVNNKYFGNDIKLINSADDSFLCDYFLKKFCAFLCPFSKLDSDLFNVTYSGKGDPVSSKPNFKLSVDQCVSLGNFIISKLYYDDILECFCLNPFDSEICLNFIKYGYPLSRLDYELVLKSKSYISITGY